MREIRQSGSEGGGASALPTPIIKPGVKRRNFAKPQVIKYRWSVVESDKQSVGKVLSLSFRERLFETPDPIVMLRRLSQNLIFRGFAALFATKFTSPDAVYVSRRLAAVVFVL